MNRLRQNVVFVPVRLDTSPSHALVSHSTTGMRRARAAVIEWCPPDGRRTVYRDDRKSRARAPGLDSRLRGNDVRFFAITSTNPALPVLAKGKSLTVFSEDQEHAHNPSFPRRRESIPVRVALRSCSPPSPLAPPHPQ